MKNPMANTFFDFDTSLNNGNNLLPLDDDDDDECLENEEEYDALNDETFGALEDVSSLDDWEQQHERFAVFEESVKHPEKLESSFSQLVLEDSKDHLSSSPPSLSNSVWSYNSPNQNGDIFNSSILSSLQKASKSFIESHSDSLSKPLVNLNSAELLPAQPRKICTVEELEKNLLKSSKHVSTVAPLRPPAQLQHPIPHPVMPRGMGPPLDVRPQIPFHPLLQHPAQNARLLPPMNIHMPGVRHVLPHLNQHHHPLVSAAPMKFLPPHPPPGFMLPIGGQNQFPINHHPFNFPGGPLRHPHNMPPLLAAQQHHQQQRNNQLAYQHSLAQQQSLHQHQQRIRNDSCGSYSGRQHNSREREELRDEYSGLMSMREKQWLLNIQMLQLNTGTPYFDDYYYTIFKERKARNNKENDNKLYYQNRRQHRNSTSRQENQNTLTPKVYTPLQFENSLGKLQCGSVTAPRKIIDMDIVTPDKDADNVQASRDSRKTKQLLLELEVLYGLLLQAEDVDNLLYITNMEKLREVKQKQRLRELELAPTPEQKQEVLRLFKLESEPVVEYQSEYIMKLLQGLLQEDKFSSFLHIRKGKMLILRLLPHLMSEDRSSHLLDLWTRVLLSLPIVGRRDTAGDNILPKYYPFFKSYVQTSPMISILEMVSGLAEVVRQDGNSNRSTPLSHVGKSPLYFVLLNRFGISSLSAMLVRVEQLMSLDGTTEKQRCDWSNFLISLVQQMELVSNIARPLEPIPRDVFVKLCDRFDCLKSDKKSLLEKCFVDSN